MNGNIVSIAIKTGTNPGLNQIRAKRISAIIGVDRMVTRIGRRKALKWGFIPAIIPNPKPRIADRINPVMPRRIVVPTVSRNLLSAKRFRVVISVFPGDGRTYSESKCIARIFHNASIKTTDARLTYCLLVKEIFIRYFSSNNIRVHLVKNVEIRLYLRFNAYSPHKFKI